MKTIIHTAVVVLLLTSVLYAQDVPPWARHLPDLPSQPGFYQGLGSARSTGDAEADWAVASGRARAQILQQIRVVVNNKVVSKIEERTSARQSSITEAFSSTTDQIATGTLENVPTERWYDEDNKTLYVYAYISKLEVESRFEEQLAAATASAKVYHEAATTALASGDPYLALSDYLQAVKGVVLAELYLDKTITGDLRGTKEKIPLLPVLQSEMCSLLSNVKFQVTGGDEQQAERGRSLSTPMTGAVLIRTATGVVPMRNAVLTAAFVPPGTGTLSPVSRTTDEGKFQFSVTEVTGGDAVSKIRVGIALPGVNILAEKLPDAVRCLSDVYLDFTFHLKTRANVTVAMHITEHNLSKKRAKSSVQEEIQKQLLGEKYTILEESQVLQAVPEEKLSAAAQSGDFHTVVAGLSRIADVVVVGLVSTEQRTNPTPGIFFCSGTAVVRAVDARSGQILASVSLDNEKEGGGSYEVAGMRLLQKMGKRIGEELKSTFDTVMK
jgi:hypothetical protein